MHNPVCWIGGKSATARFILTHFPDAASYDVFCEPFGGGANVLLHKTRSGHYELYNDLDRSLVNFWMTLRDHTDELVARLTTLPYSYALYEEYFADLCEDDPLEHAVRWFYLLRSNFKPRVVVGHPDGWASSRRNRGYSEADAFRSATLALSSVAERFRGVEIDCRDYTAVIARCDSPRTVFYIDPPYIRKGHYYHHDIAPEEMATLLSPLKGKAILSYYDCPELDTLYAGWRKVIYTKQKQLNVGGTKAQATEVLLLNWT